VNNKKNILIISAVFSPEPVVSATLSYDIAHEMSTKHDVTVLSPRPTRPLGYIFDQSNIFSQFKHQVAKSFTSPTSSVIGRLRESLSFGIASYKFIVNNNFDIVYINTWPFFAQILAVAAAKKKQIPIVVHIQDIYPESLINKLSRFKSLLTRILLPFDKWMLKNSTSIVTISNGMKGYLSKTRNVPENKIKVVYNWQDEKRFINTTKKEAQSNLFTFTYLGSLSPSASIDTIINAFEKANLKNSRLVIAGNGSEKEKLVSLSELSNNTIEFIESPFEKAGEIQSESDVLVLSLKKGIGKLALPSKLSAYMFSSKPIIACVDTDSDSANVIINSGCGWVCEPESVDSLSKLMVAIKKVSLELLADMGCRGKEYSLKYFSKQENLKELTKLIDSF
jgi:glycosyltransferase involved in cell wall biosynthesis